MATQVCYEWDIESYNEDFSDCEHEHSDNCPTDVLEENQKLVLVRDVICDVRGVIDRQWAYVVDGRLPESFSYSDESMPSIRQFFEEVCGKGNAKPVPKRFHKELNRIRNN